MKKSFVNAIVAVAGMLQMKGDAVEPEVRYAQLKEKNWTPERIKSAANRKRSIANHKRRVAARANQGRGATKKLKYKAA